MRKTFRWGELPGEKPFPSAGSDISSFVQLYRAVEDVNHRCNEQSREPGWHPAGESSRVYLDRDAADQSLPQATLKASESFSGRLHHRSTST